MNRLFNFTEEVKCVHCKHCKQEDYEESYHCDKIEDFLKDIDMFHKCDKFESVFSKETQEAFKTLEENMYWLASYAHSIYQSIGEDKDKIRRAAEAIDNIASYYINWVKNVKMEYL